MSVVLQYILEVIWLFLPAVVANIMPVLATRYNWLPQLDYPLDGQRVWRGQRILGNNKTIRGVVIGVLFGSIMGYIQHLLFASQPVFQVLSLVSYRSAIAAIVFGAWLGFGALLGDSIKSFVKRQLKIAAGKPWRPFDQIDSVLGVLLVSIWFVPLTLAHIIIALIGAWVISFVVSAVGVHLKIKKSI